MPAGMHVPCYYVCIYVLIIIIQIKDLNLHGARNVDYLGICNRLLCMYFL